MNHEATARAIDGILTDPIIPHVDHAWEQRDEFVYCTPCAARLYEGELPIGERKS